MALKQLIQTITLKGDTSSFDKSVASSKQKAAKSVDVKVNPKVDGGFTNKFGSLGQQAGSSFSSKFSQSAGKLSNSFGNFGKNIQTQTTNATSGLNGMGAAAASAAAGTAGLQAGLSILQDYSKAGLDLSKQQALANDLFGKLPTNIEAVSKSMRLNQAEALKLVNEYGLLAKGNGLSGQAAEDFALKMAKATRNVSLGSKKDLGEVQSIFNSFLKTGRTAGLETLGFDLTQIEKMKGSMSEAEFATKGFDLLLSQMPEKWKNLSESQNSYSANTERLNAQMDDQKAKFGQVVNEGLNKFAGVLIALDEKFPGFLQGLTVFIGVLAVLAVILGVVAIGFGIVSLVGAPIIGIIALIVVAIVALIAIFMNWDKIVVWFSEKWAEFTKFIGDKMNEAGQWITDKWNELMSFFQSIPAKISEFFSGIGTTISTFFQQGVDNIKNMFNGILDWFKSLPQKIGDAFSSLGDIIKKALGSAVDLLPGPLQGPLKSALGLGRPLYALEYQANMLAGTSGTVTTSNQNTDNSQTITINGGIGRSNHESERLRNNLRKRVK
jgi:hypothetical protein